MAKQKSQTTRLPSLAEQRRIVAKIEELFNAIEKINKKKDRLEQSKRSFLHKRHYKETQM